MKINWDFGRGLLYCALQQRRKHGKLPSKWAMVHIWTLPLCAMLGTKFCGYTSKIILHCYLDSTPPTSYKIYDGEILQKVESTIGKLLKIDAYTSATLRGRYARLCVELPLNKHVKPFVFIGSHKQHIL